MATPERLRRLDRVDAAATWRTARTSSCRCTRTTTAAPAVAAAELGYLAGADRIEGCLFGNGERTGNVCLVTLGLNLFTPGHRPADRLLRHRRDPAHRRVLQPAAGARAPPVRRRPRLHRLLRLAPGRHQEGLRGAWSATPPRPGVAVDELAWAVPYLPIDPKDVGRTLRGRHPGQLAVRQGRRRLHHEDRAPPRPAAPAADRVLPGRPGAAPTPRAARSSPTQIWAIFTRRVPARPRTPTTVGPLRAASAPARRATVDGDDHARRSTLRDGGEPVDARGQRQRPDRGVRRRARRASGIDVRVLDYAEHALSAGGDAQAAAYVECAIGDRVLWGVGIDAEHRHAPRSRPSSRRSTAPSADPPADLIRGARSMPGARDDGAVHDRAGGGRCAACRGRSAAHDGR